MQDESAGLAWSAERHRRVVRLCSAMTGDPHAAADLAQETYLQAARLSAPPTDDELDPWVAAVARNVCRRWLHARARGAAREHLTPTLPETSAVTAELEHEDLVALLEDALALLPSDARALLLARFVEGRSPSDIAATSGATPDAVAMRLTRAKRRLRHVLETAYAEETTARGWTSAAESGWRPTRVRCSRCGSTALDMRRDDVSVQFRCRSCSPTRPATVVPRRGVLSGLVDGVVRPSAILARVARWNADYWAGPSITSTCPGCGDPVARRAYERDELSGLAERHGWWTRCSRCDEEVSSSLLGIAAALPAVLEVRRRHLDLRLTQSTRIERDGVDAVRLGFGRVDGRVLVTAVLGRDRPGLLHVAS